MFCENCGAPLEDGDLFCVNCGFKVSGPGVPSNGASTVPNLPRQTVWRPQPSAPQQQRQASPSRPVVSPTSRSAPQARMAASPQSKPRPVAQPRPQSVAQAAPQSLTQPVPQPESYGEKPSLLMPILIGALVTVSVLLIGFILIWVLGYGYIFTGEKAAGVSKVDSEIVFEKGHDDGEVEKVTIEENTGKQNDTSVKQVSATNTIPVGTLVDNGDGTKTVMDPSKPTDAGSSSGSGSQGGSGSQDGSGSQKEPSQPAKNDKYIFPESNSRMLTREEIEKRSNWELYIGRNEIYARHGRGFKNKDLQDYFNGCSWYTRKCDPDDFDESVLNNYEKKNAVEIREVERARGSEYL